MLILIQTELNISYHRFQSFLSKVSQAFQFLCPPDTYKVCFNFFFHIHVIQNGGGHMYIIIYVDCISR